MMIERYQQKGHGNELKNQVDGVILIDVRLTNHILFLSLSFAQLLWNFFTHCAIDAQKVTAISALSRLTINSPTVFQHVIEKAGFKAVSTALASSIPKIQQGLVTMFVVLLSNRPQMRRLVQERDLATKGLHLFESPSMVIRGKAFLLVLTLI